jgi:methionyl-tRNA formyltransferase
MMGEKPRILFMGTPGFAVPTLEGLIEKGYPLIAVVTQPDRPRGRGRKSEAPPVKTTAEKHGIDVLQPERVRDEEYIRVFRELAPELVVLVAFGQILPKEIIDFPVLGCINVHPSLLPRYRGAAPMNWALIRGDVRTGVTIMRMDEGVDSGDILLQEETPIHPEDSFDSLHDRLAGRGAQLLLKTVEGLVLGTVKRQPQDHALATYAPRLKKEDGHLNWSAGVEEILNRIRGLSSSPGAYSFVRGKQLKIFTATGGRSAASGPPGCIGTETEEGLSVAAADGHVYLKEVQLEGRKRMSVRDFLRGFRVPPGEILQ